MNSLASPDVSLRAALSSKGCRPVAYFTIYTTLTGSVTAGLFLSQCGYWSALADDGWFYHTASQFTAETGLSRREQEMARRKLVALGFLEEKRAGMPAKTHFRVNESAVIFAVGQYLLSLATDSDGKPENKRLPVSTKSENKFRQKGETSFDKKVKQVSTKSENKISQKVETAPYSCIKETKEETKITCPEASQASPLSAVADVAFSSSIPEIQTPVSEQITVEIQPPVEPQISAPISTAAEDEFTLTGEPVAAKPARFKSVLKDKLPIKLQKVLTSQIEADALEVFEFWKEHHGHPNAQFTEQRAKAVVGTLAGGSTKDELLAAVRGAKRSRYHQGENETRTVYDDLELICRNRQKVEQFSAYLGTAKMATAPTAPTRLPAPATPTAPPAPPVTESDIARRIAALTESGTIVTDRPSRIQQTREYYEARMGFAELYRVLATNPDATGLPAVEEVLAFGIEHGVFASNYPEFAQMCREVFGRWLLWQHRNEIAARNAFARALEHPKFVAQVLARYGVFPATHGQEVACA